MGSNPIFFFAGFPICRNKGKNCLLYSGFLVVIGNNLPICFTNRQEVKNMERKQDFITAALSRLTKAQIISLLDNPQYRAWIIEELAEREDYKKAKEEE